MLYFLGFIYSQQQLTVIRTKLLHRNYNRNLTSVKVVVIVFPQR